MHAKHVLFIKSHSDSFVSDIHKYAYVYICTYVYIKSLDYRIIRCISYSNVTVNTCGFLCLWYTYICICIYMLICLCIYIKSLDYRIIRCISSSNIVRLSIHTQFQSILITLKMKLIPYYQPVIIPLPLATMKSPNLFSVCAFAHYRIWTLVSFTRHDHGFFCFVLESHLAVFSLLLALCLGTTVWSAGGWTWVSYVQD